MSFDIKEQDGVMLAAVIGRLDTPSAVKAQQEIVPLLENADKEIILDCEQLQYISSSGLRLFLTIRKAAAAKGGGEAVVVVRGVVAHPHGDGGLGRVGHRPEVPRT